MNLGTMNNIFSTVLNRVKSYANITYVPIGVQVRAYVVCVSVENVSNKVICQYTSNMRL